MHHFFPKALLRAEGYDEEDIDQLANLTLIDRTNIEFRDREPIEYLRENKFINACESQDISRDNNEYFKKENFKEFINTRKHAAVQEF